MSKAIARVRPTDWAMIQSIAQECYESRAFGTTKGEAAIKMLFCWENGLHLSAANQGLYVVNGRIASMGAISASQIRKHPDYDYNIERLDTKGCTISISRHGEKIGEATFDEGDAKRAQLTAKDTYQKFPEDMYFNRAMGRAQRRFAPDALSMPLYTTEELGAEVDKSGEPYTTWENVSTTIPVTPTTSTIDPDTVLELDAESADAEAWKAGSRYEPDSPTRESADSIGVSSTDAQGNMAAPGPTTIDALIAAGYSAEAIVVANEGKVPSTAADCQRVAEILERQTS